MFRSVGVARALEATYATPPDVLKHPSIVLLEAPPCLLFGVTACVGGDCLVCRRCTFFFLFP